MTDQQKRNLIDAARAAVATSRVTGCPCELLLAQWALESNYGLAAPGNNPFGYKDTAAIPGSQLLDTWERFNDAELKQFLALGEGRTASPMGPVEADGRRPYKVKDRFEVFPSIEAAFSQRAKRFNAGRNLPFVKQYFADKDLAKLFAGVAKTYATADSQQYAASLLKIIRDPQVAEALYDAEHDS